MPLFAQLYIREEDKQTNKQANKATNPKPQQTKSNNNKKTQTNQPIKQTNANLVSFPYLHVKV